MYLAPAMCDGCGDTLTMVASPYENRSASFAVDGTWRVIFTMQINSILN